MVVMMLVDVNVLVHVDCQRWGKMPGMFSGGVRFGFLLAIIVCTEDIILNIGLCTFVGHVHTSTVGYIPIAIVPCSVCCIVDGRAAEGSSQMIASALRERVWALPQRGVCLALDVSINVVGVREASVWNTRGGRWDVFGWVIPL